MVQVQLANLVSTSVHFGKRLATVLFTHITFNIQSHALKNDLEGRILAPG